MDATSEGLKETLTLDDVSRESDGSDRESERSDLDHNKEYEDVPLVIFDINGEKWVVLDRKLIEVFSVRFLGRANCYIKGNMRIKLTDSTYFLFGKEDYRALPFIEVDSQGYAMLAPDIDCPLDSTSCLAFYPELQKSRRSRARDRKKKKEKEKEKEKENEKEKINWHSWNSRYEECGQTLYHNSVDRNDSVVCKRMQTQVGPVDITYAVFVDAVEVLVGVTLINWRRSKSEEPVELYGSVTTKSTMIGSPRAKSVLFQREQASDQYFRVEPGEQSGDRIPLPLSRRKTVLPRNAFLQVRIDIWQRTGDNTGGRRLAKGKMEAEPYPGKAFEKVFESEDFDIRVKFKWLKDKIARYESDDDEEEDDS